MGNLYLSMYKIQILLAMWHWTDGTIRFLSTKESFISALNDFVTTYNARQMSFVGNTTHTGVQFMDGSLVTHTFDKCQKFSLTNVDPDFGILTVFQPELDCV